MTTLPDQHITVMLSVTIKLRLATAEDLPKLEWYGQYRHFRNIFRRAFEEQQAGRRDMLLADVHNFPIGQIFIQYHSEQADFRGHAYFYSFRVMEMFRGQGIGTLLMGEAENRVRQRGLNWITIAAAKQNTGACRLYERLGYRIYGEDRGQWSYVDHRGRTHRVQEPCWLLEKSLKP